jgi:hypothetical protein
MEIVRRDSVPAFVAPDKAIIRELAASRNSSAKKQSLAEATIAVGDAVTEHYHKVTEEFYTAGHGPGAGRELDTVESTTRPRGIQRCTQALYIFRRSRGKF